MLSTICDEQIENVAPESTYAMIQTIARVFQPLLVEKPTRYDRVT